MVAPMMTRTDKGYAVHVIEPRQTQHARPELRRAADSSRGGGSDLRQALRPKPLGTPFGQKIASFETAVANQTRIKEA